MLNYDLNFRRIFEVIPKWSWSELKKGIDRKIIYRKDIVLYARFILSEGQEKFDLILELAIAEEDEVDELLYQLILNEQEYNNGLYQLILKEENHDELLSQLTLEEDEFDKLLSQLLLEKQEYEEKILQKWTFAIIYDAYIYSLEKINDIIEEIYVEFDYPEELSNLVTYMPCDCEKALEERICRYIKKGKREWCI